MDWHIRLKAVAPDYKLTRLLNCWVLSDKDGKYVGRFRTCDEAIAHAKGLTERGSNEQGSAG